MKTIILFYLITLSAIGQPSLDETGPAMFQVKATVVAGGGPTFGAETQQYDDQSSAATDVITLTTGISSGTAIVMARISDSTATLTSVTDSKGNTWTIRVFTNTTAGARQYGAIATATVSSALTTSDTITLNWGTVSGFCARMASINYITGASSFDTSAFNNSAGIQTSLPSLAGTVAANSLQVGMIFEGQNIDTISSPSWTAISRIAAVSEGVAFNYYNNDSIAGVVTMSGTLSDTTHWACIFVSFK